MKIVVTGAAGAMAWPGLIYLLEQPDVTEILLCDLSEAGVKERIKKLGDDKRLKAQVLDLMDIKASAKAFAGYDVLYNCAFMTTCTAATQAALEAGLNYLDLGGFQKEEQLKFSDSFKKKGIIGICGVGTASGMSNIMAAYGVQQLDKPESVEILDACVDMVPDTEHTRPLYWGYAIEGIIDEFFKDGAYFDEGQLKYIPARSYPEVVNFRPPAGQVKVATTVHSEPISLSKTFKDRGLKHASWKIGFDTDFEEKMTFLRNLGLFKTEPIEADGQKVSPRALLLKLLFNQPPETKKAPDFRGHMIVVVKGEQAGQKVEYTITEYATADLTLKMQKKGVFSSYRTGIYGAIGAVMIGRGQIEKKGVFYPEACVPPELFLKETAKAGIEVDVSKKVWL
jgi:lysine 6-dehydrogenase